MKLAYGFHTNSCLLQAVPPARRSSDISDGVVPTTMLMYITAGGDAGTRRHACWGRRLGRAEARAFSDKSVRTGGIRERLHRTTHNEMGKESSRARVGQ